MIEPAIKPDIEPDCAPDREPGVHADLERTHAALAAAALPGVPGVSAGTEVTAATLAPQAGSADPWAAILEAGAAMLQGLAAARSAGGASIASSASTAATPFAIERDPVTGQASVRLPLPDPAVLQRLAKALEPWLR